MKDDGQVNCDCLFWLVLFLLEVFAVLLPEDHEQVELLLDLDSDVGLETAEKLQEQRLGKYQHCEV